MPIRHCQKCGLKVLIDESQTASNPFYCQRCTASMKSDGGIAALQTPPRRLTPAATPSPAAVAAAAATTVKVFCPYCKASFNGRIPQKPARGQCPLCQKDLILLPNGDIRPAAGFDPSQWQKSAAGSSKPPEIVEEAPQETGTQMLVKKFAADPGAAVARASAGARILSERPAPAPPDETQTPDLAPAPLPDWLDEAPKAPAPVPAPVQAPADTAEAESVNLDDLPDVAPPPPPPPPPRRVASRTMPAAPPPPPPPPAAKRSGGTGVQKKVTERRVPSGTTHEAVPSGAGKFMLALLLAALPVVACPILLASRASLKGSILEKMGALFTKGFQALDQRLFPVAEAAPAPVEEKKAVAPPPEAPARPTAEDQRQMEEEINKRWMEFKREERTVRQLSVGATDAQKAEIQKAQTELKQKQQRIDELRESYRKIFGKDYDPTKQ